MHVFHVLHSSFWHLCVCHSLLTFMCHRCAPLIFLTLIHVLFASFWRSYPTSSRRFCGILVLRTKSHLNPTIYQLHSIRSESFEQNRQHGIKFIVSFYISTTHPFTLSLPLSQLFTVRYMLQSEYFFHLSLAALFPEIHSTYSDTEARLPFVCEELST